MYCNDLFPILIRTFSPRLHYLVPISHTYSKITDIIHPACFTITSVVHRHHIVHSWWPILLIWCSPHNDTKEWGQRAGNVYFQEVLLPINQERKKIDFTLIYYSNVSIFIWYLWMLCYMCRKGSSLQLLNLLFSYEHHEQWFFYTSQNLTGWLVVNL